MDPPGHETLTNESVKAAVRDFPPSLNWVRYYLADTMVGSVYRDVDDILNGGHWSPEGQKHHFMRFPGQRPLDAYKEALGWIHYNAYTAAKRLREIWQQPRRRVYPVYINEPLGDALHTVQDSYSRGHVSRKKVGDAWIIDDIFIYDAANQKTHRELDERWKTDDLGKEAIVAGRELIRIVVKSSLMKMDAGEWLKWKSLWETYVSVFFMQDFD
jgi:hypothetical protein